MADMLVSEKAEKMAGMTAHWTAAGMVVDSAEMKADWLAEWMVLM